MAGDASVSNVKPGAVVDSVKPDAAVSNVSLSARLASVNPQLLSSYVDGQLTATYVDPDILTVYVEPAASAFLDTTGRRKIVHETVLASDTFDYYLTRVIDLAEAPELVDVVAIDYAKLTGDVLTVPDALAIDFRRPASDAYSFTDSVTRAFGKVLAELQSIADSLAIAMGWVREPADSVTMGDVLAKIMNFGRTLSDGFAMDDMAAADSLAIEYVTAKSNIVGVSETLTKNFSKTPTGESFGLTETFAIGWNKSFADVATAGESMLYTLEDVATSVINSFAINQFELNS